MFTFEKLIWKVRVDDHVNMITFYASDFPEEGVDRRTGWTIEEACKVIQVIYTDSYHFHQRVLQPGTGMPERILFRGGRRELVCGHHDSQNQISRALERAWLPDVFAESYRFLVYEEGLSEREVNKIRLAIGFLQRIENEIRALEAARSRLVGSFRGKGQKVVLLPDGSWWRYHNGDATRIDPQE
ncbi:MAG: hypothetical protein ACOCXQ_03450 [Patescibacteria group bacterium]